MKSGVLLSSNLPRVINQSMTIGKLLDNNTPLFIFYFYSNDDPRDPENRQQNWFSVKNSYNQLNGKGWLTAVVLNIIG